MAYIVYYEKRNFQIFTPQQLPYPCGNAWVPRLSDLTPWLGHRAVTTMELAAVSAQCHVFTPAVNSIQGIQAPVTHGRKPLSMSTRCQVFEDWQ